MQKYFFFICLMIVIKTQQENQIDQLKISSRQELLNLFKQQQKNVFIFFQREDCGYCKNLMKILPQAYKQAKEEFKLDFKLYYFNCTRDGFCKNKFDTSGYPDFRYYPIAIDPKSKFIKLKNLPAYKQIDIILFIKSRIEGTAFELSFNNIEQTLTSMKNNLIRKEKKVLLFCQDNFQNKEINLIQQVARIQEDILLISLKNCDTQTQFKNQYLQQFKTKLEQQKEQIALIKLENEEVNFFDGKSSAKELLDFVKTYKKEVIYKINDYFMSRVMSKNQPALIMFLNSGDQEVYQEFYNFSEEIIKQNNVLLAVHQKNEDEDEQFNARYLKQIFGLQEKDLPAIRLIQKAGQSMKKFKFEGQIQSHKILNFYNDFINQDLTEYQKNQLENLELLQDCHSIIQDFNYSLLNNNYSYDNHVFVLILGEASSLKTQQSKEQFEKIILKQLEQNSQFIEENMSFQIASIFREDIDDLVPNSLPVLFYFQKNQANNKPSIYFWNEAHFEQMIQLLIQDFSIRDQKNFMDISSLKVNEL